MFKNLIFDVDGTIADTEAVILRSLSGALREQGVEYAEQDLRFILGLPAAETVTKLGAKEPEALLRRWAALEDAEINLAPVFSGWEEVFTVLRKSGCPLGVVTSRLRGSFDEYMARIGCDDLFHASVCCGEAARNKPYPDPMQKCLEKLGGQASQSVYIGDSIYDMRCAKGAGVAFALALWGSQTTKGFEEADYILEKPEEILQFIKK